MDDMLSLLTSSATPKQSGMSKMMLAMLLKWLAEQIEEEEPTESGTMPPATEAFKEQGVRVRPDWMPSGG